MESILTAAEERTRQRLKRRQRARKLTAQERLLRHLDSLGAR